MHIKEYRIVLPMSVEEYQIGQLYSVAQASKQETGGGEGVEVLVNQQFDDIPLFNGKYTSGQYTHKIYHLESKVPSIVKAILPKGSMAIHEHAWNAYPYCKTELTNPDYMKDNFFVRIETIHLDNDRGHTKNAHHLPDNILRNREVVHIDIANDKEFLYSSDIVDETSPSKFHSSKADRGPLHGGWRKNIQPVMCAYKLVTIYFKWFGLQNMVEMFGHKQYPRLFCKFHREVFCWIDEWYGLTLVEIRELEEQTKRELDEARKSGKPRGMTA
ncbi:unnamed protein product [Meloidogyne enterolobii]|uniref:Uncharacterized protein n=2 Tax=Meloidogyne enterolobii TaxID=390850 RepID=A0ACB0Z7X6_MELEN|nr:unnamed protein product [Meloidogyne enterolobii]